MAGRIPEHILEEILSRTDIVEVVSGYIPLKRAGRNYKANCPFHHEKTPSFVVSPDRQIYHCFGCGKGGNVFSFLMEYERLEFLETVELLARKAGIALPEKQERDDKTANLTTLLYKVNELASAFYARNLISQHPQSAKQYLLKRGIKEETISRFRLGVAFDKWDALIIHLRDQHISLSTLEKAGLILAKDAGGYYDRFRNRIVFPIFDIKSRPVAFGARVLDASLPKYINSPETPLYSKGKNLYGLNFAKDAIRDLDSVIIVEGYLDCIVPSQEGVENIVASLGTALTFEQARLLKRYTHNVVMVYDPDKAGELATLRGLDIFVEEGMSVRIVSLPQGCDPDLYVRKYGIEKLKMLIAGAADLFDFKLKVLRSRYNASEVAGKAKISHEMLLTIQKFKSAVMRSEYLKRLAEALHVHEEALLQDLQQLKAGPSVRDEAIGHKRSVVPVSPTERLLLKLMLEEAECINKIRAQVNLEDFQDARVVRIVESIFDIIDQGRDVESSKLINHLQGQEEVLQIICESCLLPDIEEGQKEKVIQDCIQRLKSQRLWEKKQQLQNEINSAQDGGDEEKLNSLMQEFNRLIKSPIYE
jgi:DNA primase